MFADPQTVTIDSVAQVMPRVLTDGTKSIYQLADKSYKLTISDAVSNDRHRSMVRLDHRDIVEDPLTTVNDYGTVSFYCVIDRPEYGFTTTQIQLIIAGLKTWLDNTAIAKMIGSET